jgi:putative serine protease PepD
MEYGYSESQGALVMSVIAGTGAAAAGIQQGDVIAAINGQAVASNSDVSSIISSLRPGDVINVTLERGTKTLHISVTLGHIPNGY